MEKDLEENEINHNDTSLIMKEELKILIENQSALNQNDIVGKNEVVSEIQDHHGKQPLDGGIWVMIGIMLTNCFCPLCVR